MNVSPGVDKIVKAAMGVIWETFDLDASCVPRLKYACGVASVDGVEWISGACCGRGDGTADGWVAASGVLVDANGGGEDAGVHAWESGVWIDGDVVEYLRESLLLFDQCLDVSHRELQVMDEVFLLLPGERYGVGREQDVLGVCTQECDVCLDGFVGVGQDLQAVGPDHELKNPKNLEAFIFRGIFGRKARKSD